MSALQLNLQPTVYVLSISADTPITAHKHNKKRKNSARPPPILLLVSACLTSEKKRSSSDDEDERLSESEGFAHRIRPGVTVILELIRPLLAVG